MSIYKQIYFSIFSKIHEALGFDQLRNGVTLPGLHTASAPLKPEILLYLQSLDMVLYDSFGSTETMCLTVSNMTGMQQVLEYQDFDYRDPRNTRINGHNKVKVSLITGKNSITVIFPGKSRYSRLISAL